MEQGIRRVVSTVGSTLILVIYRSGLDRTTSGDRCGRELMVRGLKTRTGADLGSIRFRISTLEE